MRAALTIASLLASGLPLIGQQNPGTALRTPQPEPAPAWALHAFDTLAGTVQELEVPVERQAFRFLVELGGELLEVALEPSRVRSPGFRVLVDDGSAVREVAPPPEILFRGTVPGWPEAQVAASVDGGRLQALVSLGTQHPDWRIDSLQTVDLDQPAARCLVHSARSVRPRAGGQSVGVPLGGVALGSVPSRAPSSAAAGSGGPGIQSVKIADLALDLDFDFYTLYGADVQQATNQALARVAEANLVFLRDVDLEHRVGTVLVRTMQVYTASDLQQLLADFRARWLANHGNVPRDVAQLFTGRPRNGQLSRSYIGTVCRLDSAFGVTLIQNHANPFTNLLALGNSLGFSWNAANQSCNTAACFLHCSNFSTCSSGAYRFSASNQIRIRTYADGAPCLDEVFDQPVLTSVAPARRPVFPISGLTLQGTGLEDVDRVTLGGVDLPILTATETMVTTAGFLPTALGVQDLQVFNPSFSSNTLQVTVDVTSPPVHTAPGFSFRGQTLVFDLAGTPGRAFVLHASFNDERTFPFVGFDILLDTLPLDAGTLNALGYRRFVLQVPDVSLTGLVVRSQLVLIDAGAGTLDFATPVLPTLFFR